MTNTQAGRKFRAFVKFSKELQPCGTESSSATGAAGSGPHRSGTDLLYQC